MDFYYDFMASLFTLALVSGIVSAGRFLLFRIPAIAQTVEINRTVNQIKWDHRKREYHQQINSSPTIALWISLIFYLVIMPFAVTLEAQSLVKIVIDVFLILMVYDFFYYLTHRFVLHGQGFFHRVHAIHHKARSRVSSVDALMLHPAETFIGIGLFHVVALALAVVTGGPFHISTIVICSVVYTQINQINHCRIGLNKSPWRTLSWIAICHDAHHLDMHRGNFGTITLLYDWMFGTFEKHPSLLDGAKNIPK